MTSSQQGMHLMFDTTMKLVEIERSMWILIIGTLEPEHR